jgi:hypothetical protein
MILLVFLFLMCFLNVLAVLLMTLLVLLNTLSVANLCLHLSCIVSVMVYFNVLP